MTPKYYDTAIFGATFLGLGAALNTENTVVIEKGGTFGAEFVNSYRVCKPAAWQPQTKSGQEFLQQLRARGLISDKGEIYAGPTVYVLSKYLLEKQPDILLTTEVADIKKVDGYFQITLYHAGGFEEIFAHRILDTTALGIGHINGQRLMGRKCLNAIVHNPKHREMEQLFYNSASGLYTYSLPVEPEVSRQEAVELLSKKAAEFSENGLSIISIASDFAYDIAVCRKEIEKNFTWIPSAGYADPVEAYDAGAACIGNMHVKEGHIGGAFAGAQYEGLQCAESLSEKSDTGAATVLRQIRNGKLQTTPTEPDFTERYDLIVVGLGTAGAISLITACREGLSVLGVEQTYCMGGTGTVGNICGYYFGAEGGLYMEFDEKAKALQDTVFWNKNRRDTKALIYEREAMADGANIKYYCTVIGVFMQSNRVIGLRLLQNGKITDVAADKIIDASGEAIVCHLAGCESTYGRSFDGQAQPTTSAAILIAVDGTPGGTNKDAGYVDPGDPRAVSRTIIRSNTFPMYLKDDYREEKRKFIGTAPLFGVREGRHIIGRKTLRLEDILHAEKEPVKPLFYAFSNIDNHGKDRVFENRELCDWMDACGLWGVLMSVPVPMEVLLPQNIENVMVAGRCLSVDHNLAACVRMKRDMAKCGEAAAYICGEAIRKQIPLSEVAYEDIVEKLKRTGCLSDANNVGFRERAAGSYLGNELPKVSTPEEIAEQLATEKPGWAIYAAKNFTSKEELAALLKNKLKSENENLSRNAALALGLMGESCALNKLRQMAGEPDNLIPKSSLKFVQTRGVSAIYLLGRLGDDKSVPLLFKIVENRGRTALTDFIYGEFYNEATDVYSQYVLFAVRALLEIARKHPEQKEAIIQRVTELLAPEDYTVPVTLRENSASLHDLKPKLLQYVESFANAWYNER